MNFLDQDDMEEFYALCRRMWGSPPQEPLPSSLPLSVPSSGCGTKRPVFIDRDGVRLGREERQTFYGWSDVRRWIMVCPDRDRIDFYEATLEVADESLVFCRSRKHKSKQWTGTSASIVARFLQQYVPVENTLVVPRFGLPQSLEEVDYFLAKSERAVRLPRFPAAALAVVIGVMCLAGEWPLGLLTGLSWGGLFLLAWFVERRKQAKYLAIRDQLLSKAHSEIAE
jgi:hypothetical protein